MSVSCNASPGCPTGLKKELGVAESTSRPRRSLSDLIRRVTRRDPVLASIELRQSARRRCTQAPLHQRGYLVRQRHADAWSQGALDFTGPRALSDLWHSVRGLRPCSGEPARAAPPSRSESQDNRPQHGTSFVLFRPTLASKQLYLVGWLLAGSCRPPFAQWWRRAASEFSSGRRTKRTQMGHARRDTRRFLPPSTR